MYQETKGRIEFWCDLIQKKKKNQTNTTLLKENTVKFQET